MSQSLNYLPKKLATRSLGYRSQLVVVLLLTLVVGVFGYLRIARAGGSAPVQDDEKRCRRRCKEEQTPPPKPTPKPPPPPESTAQTVTLYYFRQATKIAAVLNAIASPDGSELHGMVVTPAAENELILYGSDQQRKQARQVIAALDLPRPGVKMGMWGIQISSQKAEEMSHVMPKVRGEISRTQRAVRETYQQLQRLVREKIPDDELEPWFTSILEDKLGYGTALEASRQLSISDIVLRMAAAKDPSRTTTEIAIGIRKWLEGSPYRDYLADSAKLSVEGNQPFERFFNTRGLYYENHYWVDRGVTPQALQGRVAVLEFALQYGRLIHDTKNSSPYRLQQAGEALNARLQLIVDAMNQDISELFVAPTLARIQEDARFKGVEYAQVGRTTVASLSGTATEVTSHSVNAFDVTPPLRLSELLKTATDLSKSTETFVPHPAENVVGAMPYSQVIGLIAALGEERSVWRELQSGVSFTITPNVLRNMTSAELDIDLKTGDPQAGTREKDVRPLSRVSQHDVKTTVYVDALDFFDLSAFASQSTLGGGRGYVPIIGPVWNGVFGEIPFAGKLFSWPRNPKTVYSESLVLTNSFITPTVMGLALLYPTERRTGSSFDNQEWYVDLYRNCRGNPVCKLKPLDY